MKKVYIIKIGGNVIDDADALEKFLNDFSKIDEYKILVHGGGKPASELAKKLGVSQSMVNGRRITDAETLKIVTMVYAGLINKQLVATLQSKKINAIGLSGADLNMISAQKRPIIDIDYGFVGDVDDTGVNTEVLSTFIETGIVPVFSAITHDGKGQLLNTNADTMASALAVALSKKYKIQLNYCFEKKGVLKNILDENSVIKTMTKTEYLQLLKDGIISEGMIPKLDNAFSAIQKGVSAVFIAHSSDLLKTIQNEHAGTKLIN
ncbi:MAG: acetylglutamate kinase [Flavobacteriaceae bacterium]|nr:acetylglutamate kinase [Flavobacteriaceae bacterium]